MVKYLLPGVVQVVVASVWLLSTIHLDAEGWSARCSPGQAGIALPPSLPCLPASSKHCKLPNPRRPTSMPSTAFLCCVLVNCAGSSIPNMLEDSHLI